MRIGNKVPILFVVFPLFRGSTRTLAISTPPPPLPMEGKGRVKGEKHEPLTASVQWKRFLHRSAVMIRGLHVCLHSLRSTPTSHRSFGHALHPHSPPFCAASLPPVSTSIPPSSLVTSLLSSLFSLAFVTRDVTGACDGAPVACDKACATKARRRLARIPAVTWWWTSERLGWHDVASSDLGLTAHFCPFVAVPSGSFSLAKGPWGQFLTPGLPQESVKETVEGGNNQDGTS